jgi:uncharacterized integral membrane protein
LQLRPAGQEQNRVIGVVGALFAAAPGFHFNARHCMSILISILITFVVVILVLYLVNMLPIDGRAKQIVRVVVIIIGIISLLRYLAVF